MAFSFFFFLSISALINVAVQLMSSLMLKLIVNMKISRNTNHFSSKFITTISYKTKAETRHNDTDYFVHFSGQPVIL